MINQIVEQRFALAEKQGRLRRRKGDAQGLIIHTTGNGPTRRHLANPEKFPSPYDAALHIYENISPYCGHFLICGETGKIAQLVPLNHSAWHVGSAGAWKYRFPTWAANRGFGWWFVRFPGLTSPRDLLDGTLWRRGSANELTYGVEIAPPLAGPRAPWSHACWDTLDRLISFLEIPRDRYHVFTHSDAHPLKRVTGKDSPWDPAPKQWMISDASIRLRLEQPPKIIQ